MMFFESEKYRNLLIFNTVPVGEICSYAIPTTVGRKWWRKRPESVRDVEQAIFGTTHPDRCRDNFAVSNRVLFVLKINNSRYILQINDL
jgi:hypothetical protein